MTNSSIRLNSPFSIPRPGKSLPTVGKELASVAVEEDGDSGENLYSEMID